MAELSELVASVLRATPVFDGHNDLPAALRGSSGYGVEGLDTGRPELHTDIPRLRAGGVGAQFWSVFVPSTLSEPEAVTATLEQVDAVYRMVARYPEAFAMAYTAADVERVTGSGRIASLLGIEGGHSIATSLGVLRAFARLGVRYLTLTHNDSTSWADSATDEPRAGGPEGVGPYGVGPVGVGPDGVGLDGVGLAIVAEMNRLGVLVDLSHVAATRMHAALDATTAPVIFSHSSTRALCGHPRNVPDDVLTRLAANGGVVQLTFVPAFISADVAHWWAGVEAERERLGLPIDEWTWPRAPLPGESAAAVAAEYARGHADRSDAEAAADERFAHWLAGHPRPEVSLSEVADHVEHARDVAGPDHIGLGGDYDGVDLQPAELADVSGYPRLLEELARRGWSATELTALTGRNVLRVLRGAEEAATGPLWPATPLR
jgi:membrane dipeptidase